METYAGLIWSAEFDDTTVRLTRLRDDMTRAEIVALTNRLNAEEVNRHHPDLGIEFIEPVKVAGKPATRIS
jgi:hypothetical protein